MNQIEFKELHASCVMAFQKYVTSAELTATMLADCTPEPMPLGGRLDLLIQESDEEQAHSIYLDTKRILNNAARMGYLYSD